MNRSLSGAVIAWRTRNTRKMKRAEAWCADYGLAPIHKALHVGSLYESERTALEKKFKNLLTGRYERYCVLTVCALCLRGFNAIHETSNINGPYEIV